MSSNDVLGYIPLFANLPADERAELSQLLKTRKYSAHQPVVWLGEQGDDFYIVHSGKVAVSAPDETGKEVVLTTLSSGQFFGEISLLDGGPRTATVRTLTDASMLVLVREDFLNFLRRHPDAAIYMLTILGQRQRETNEKLRGIRNVNEAVEARRTPLERITERVASLYANEIFVALNVLFFAAWIVFNSWRSLHGKPPFDDPPTFFTLGFIITLEAILISMFVLNSQKQQNERDRIRADLDYQVNLKAHQEVMQLHRKVDLLQSIVSKATANGSAGAPTEAVSQE